MAADPSDTSFVDISWDMLGDKSVSYQEPTGGAEFNPDFDGGEECLGIHSAFGIAKDMAMFAALTSKSFAE